MNTLITNSQSNLRDNTSVSSTKENLKKYGIYVVYRTAEKMKQIERYFDELKLKESSKSKDNLNSQIQPIPVKPNSLFPDLNIPFIAEIFRKEIDPIRCFKEGNREKMTLESLPEEYYCLIGALLKPIEIVRICHVCKGIFGRTNQSLCIQLSYLQKMEGECSFIFYPEIMKRFFTYDKLPSSLSEEKKIFRNIPYDSMFKLLNKNLCSLNLAYLPIKDDDLVTIKQQCPELRTIDLSRCLEITDRALDILSEFKSLTSISFFGCTKITASKVADFHKAHGGKIHHQLSNENPANISLSFQSDLEAFKPLEIPTVVIDPITADVIKSSIKSGVKRARNKLEIQHYVLPHTYIEALGFNNI